MIDVLKRLQGEDLPVNVVGGISSQEEVGTRGAVITSRAIKPDMAIVFEGSPADDTIKDPFESQGALKKGSQIRHRDNSYVANNRLIKFAREIGKKKDVKFQDAVRRSGGTDAGKIALSHIAVPVLVLGVPVRYAHTHYGFSSLTDYIASIDLAVALLRKVTDDTIKSL